MHRQDVVDDLLRELGFDIQLNTPQPDDLKKCNEFEPIRMDKEIAIFTTDQIDVFGNPEQYGYDKYQVIESDRNMVPDFSFDKNRDKPRPIHRYNRVERFEFILAQLLGLRGDIPYYVMAVMQYADKTPEKCYDSIRRILKHYKFRKFYNRIPLIMVKLGIGALFDWDKTDETYREIINDFRILQAKFERQKKFEWQRKYFPPLRFIAIKLIEKHGGKCNFDIHFIRTKRKEKLLGNIWQSFGL